MKEVTCENNKEYIKLDEIKVVKQYFVDKNGIVTTYKSEKK
jgi:hypothetical protein